MNKLGMIAMAAALLTSVCCNKEYDPIGPNKPVPVLIVSPLELAFDSEGGTLSSKISTNAQQVTIGDLPDWVESAKVNEDNTSITIVAKPNTTTTNARRANLKLISASGDNNVTQYVKLFQAGKSSKIAFAAFSGKVLPTGWVAQDAKTVSVGNGFLVMKSTADQDYTYTCPQVFNSKTARYYFSVDLKMNGAEGGVKLYVNDNPNQVVQIYLSFNSNTNRGSIYVKNGSSWCAMDDGAIGSGSNDGQYGDVVAVPASGEREDWWRLVIFTTETAPDQPVVSVRSLKTFNGETTELAANYSRQFTFIPSDPGRIALWSENGECQFKNFVLSYQE